MCSSDLNVDFTTDFKIIIFWTSANRKPFISFSDKDSLFVWLLCEVMRTLWQSSVKLGSMWSVTRLISETRDYDHNSVCVCV